MKLDLDSAPVISEFSLLAIGVHGATGACKDGDLSARDIARASGARLKTVMRTIARHVADAKNGHANPGGATIELGGPGIPRPDTVTRAEMAVHVARHLGLLRAPPERGKGPAGRAIPIKRLAAVAAQTGKSIEELRPDLNEAERSVAMGYPNGHAYRDNDKGRSITTRQEPGSGHIMIARLACSTPTCRTVGEVRLRDLPGPEIIDRKFKQQGWRLDPHRCPPCQQKKREKKMGVASPSPAAVHAQAKMFTLLNTNFDGATGLYSNGYSDAKVAEEAGVSPELVKGVRDEVFGPLKEPPEIAKITADIDALESLLEETIAPIKSELRTLRERVTEVRRKFAA